MFDIFNMLKKEAHTAPKQVTRDTIIGDILDMDQTTAPYFMEIGMHCLGCPASRGETIEEACEVHGVNCDELLEKLAEAGFSTTQATISRDIREINLTKVAVAGGRQKYTLGKSATHESIESYRKVLGAGILSMVPAENLIVIKTVSGMAMAVAAALDNVEINGLLGSIAGDDTIFLAVRSREMTDSVMKTIDKMQR